MTSSSDIGIIVRFRGVIVGATRVDRMIDFGNLRRVLSDIARLNLYSLKVSSVYTDNNASSSIPIKNNRDLRFLFNPSAGFNSIELLVESETLVHPQTPLNAWNYQYHQSVGTNQRGGNDTNVGPFGITNYFTRQNTIMVDLSGDRFGADDPSNSEPSDNRSSDEGSSDRDDDAEEQMSKVPASSYVDVPIDSIGTSSWDRDLIYNSDSGILRKGMIFKDKKHLQSAVKDYSVRHARRKYRVVGGSSTTWQVVCKQNITNNPSFKDCSWFLRGKFYKKYNHWKIAGLGPRHSCLTDIDSKGRKIFCKDTFAADIESKVHIEPAYEVKFVMEHALTQYDYEISYQKAWQVLKHAREKVFGTWESSCQYLPKFMGALQKYNPGTIVGWRHKDGNIGVVHTLGYVFWAFRPCIEAFRHCRKILTVDGTYLYTKYKHKLLIANTLDADQKIIPVAYAIVDEENLQSWYWFLQMLAMHIVRDVEGICLISGMHKDILKAVEYIPAFHPSRSVHRYCLRHVASNINTQFKSVRLKDLCYSAGKSMTVGKFEELMNEIESLNHDAYEYLTTIDPSKWTFCHDGGHRFGVMTTNIHEAINGVLKGTRRLPITAIVSMTFTRSKDAFLKREEVAYAMTYSSGVFAPLPNEKEWDEPCFQLKHNPNRKIRCRGRDVVMR